MEYLRTFTKEIEQVSVDECYMDFTGIAGRYHSPVDGRCGDQGRDQG